MIKVRFLKERFNTIEPLPDGRYYLRAIIEETDEEIFASESILDHYPTESEISKATSEAAVEKSALDLDQKQRLISELKQQLLDTDYKVVKNSEWAEKERLETGNYPNSGYPYDPQELYNTRQAIRDQINELEV